MDDDLVKRLRDACRGGDTCKCSLNEAADRIEALTKELARSTRLISKMVPLSSCGNYVFWDGVGDIELDHNGELRSRIEALERERDDAVINRAAWELAAREAALDALAAGGQAQEAYEAQLKAEAKVEELEREVERRIEPEQVERLIELAEPIMAELYAAECAYRKEAEAERDEAKAMQECGCAYENPTDICAGHHALFERVYGVQRAALEARLEAATHDAKEAEAYAEELERERDEARKYRDAYAQCDRIGTQAVRDLEAKLAKAVEALREIAAEASVRVEVKKHGGISHKKLYKGWRKLAVKRIDIARAALAEIEGGRPEVTQEGNAE